MSLKIEKGVPHPGTYRNKYPWASMDVGDSFFEEILEAPAALRAAKLIRASAHGYASRHGGAFSVRVVTNGVRAWRVK